MKNDRMEMLKQMTQKNKINMDVELFNKYLPNYYPEVYSLYSLLDETMVHHKDIVFNEPIIVDDNITIIFSSSKKDFKLVEDKISEKKNKIKYLRDHKFNIELSGNNSGGLLKFVRN